MVALGDGSGEVAVCQHDDQAHVSLRGTGDHVLDEVAVARGIDDGVVPLLSAELLGGAGDNHALLSILLLPVHEEGDCERGLAQVLGLLLQLLQLMRGQRTKLEDRNIQTNDDQSSGGADLAAVDMTANNNGEVWPRGSGGYAASQLLLQSQLHRGGHA